MVGAGILGLATARELLVRAPGREVVVLEREPEVATHQTGHSSGVVHAGIYYAPGSLKARLCTSGARDLHRYCEERGVAFERCGKVIVAAEPGELPALAELERRGHANGVPGLRRLDAGELAEVEPHARGVAALHSPATAIVDFRAVARALAADVTRAGGRVETSRRVTALRPGPRGIRVEHAGGAVEADFAVACAGAWSDRLAVAAGAPRDPRIVPFRGAYLRLRPERRHLVRALVYPVPDPRLPFLGPHFTKHADGEVAIGPTALLVGARDAYRLGRVSPRDVAETLAWPGTWRMARRWWRAGATELARTARPRALVREAARLVPELGPEDVLPGPAGVRAQALGRDGRLLDDFAFSRTERALHVRNAPSPAATAALAMARTIADEVEQALR